MNQVTISESDLYEIKLRCGGEPEAIEIPAREEMALLKQIKAGNKQGFHITVWEMEGKINTKRFMDNAEQLVLQRPELRSNFIFQGVTRPFRVVSKKTCRLLQIVNLNEIGSSQRALVMQNVLAAQARKRYDPQTDSLLQLVGFLTDNRRMILLISVYPHIPIGLSLQEMIAFIFADMKITHGRLENLSGEKVEKLNRDLEEACMKYWKKEIIPVGEPVVFPGQLEKKTGGREDSLYKGFPAQLDEKFRLFRNEQKCTGRAILLAAWAELFGRQYGVGEPVLWICGSGERLKTFPVKVRRTLPRRERFLDIDRQLADSVKYSACSFEELCGCLDMKEEYFQTVFQCVELQEGKSMDGITGEIINMPEECKAAMTISCYLLGGETRLNYSYRQECFYHTTVKKLHEVFLRLIEEQISEEKEAFNLREYIELEVDTRAKRRKLQTAQKALYLKETGLFEKRSAEELMSLAGKAQLGQYSMSDVILTERQPVCACAFLVDGNAEESRVGADGIVKSISVKKAGDCFAMEALFEENITQFTYAVASEEAKVVWIERRDLIAFLNEEPENWRAFLEAAVREAGRMKRLWTVM